MINPRELLEDLEWDGTTIVIKKLINIVEELENKINEQEMLANGNLVDVEMKLDADSRSIGELMVEINFLKDKIEKLKK